MIFIELPLFIGTNDAKDREQAEKLGMDIKDEYEVHLIPINIQDICWWVTAGGTSASHGSKTNIYDRDGAAWWCPLEKEELEERLQQIGFTIHRYKKG